MRFVIFFIFLNTLLWLGIIPVFHTPDEQAHFGEVAYLVEKGDLPDGKSPDLTSEIYISEKLLGTDRDKLGNNKFTFHPEYKIEYAEGFMGKYEKYIKSLAKTEAKNNFVRIEAAHYPRMYYLGAALLYRLFYSSDLFTRVFVIRFYSLFLFLINIYFIYKIVLILSPNNSFFASVVSILVGLQPMMIFANIGVTSDSLGNLLFTLFLYFSLQTINQGIKLGHLLPLLAISTFAVLVKPQFIIVVPIIFFLLTILFFKDAKKGRLVFLFLTIILLTSSMYLLYSIRFGPMLLLIEVVSRIDYESLAKFTREYTLTHTISEVLPWYWGVYKWLGVTYSRPTHRVINRLLMISIFGLFVWFYKIIRNRKWSEKQFQGVIFLIVVNIIYFAALSIYDWYSWYTKKYQLGIQGRYFFPLIGSHMILILIGWDTLSSAFMKIRNWLVLILEVLMIGLNFIGIYTILSSYYELSSFEVVLKQMSQYKPALFKGPLFVILFIVYLFLLVKLIYLQISYLKKKSLTGRDFGLE